VEEGYNFGSGCGYSYYKCLGEDRCRSTRRLESPLLGYRKGKQGQLPAPQTFVLSLVPLAVRNLPDNCGIRSAEDYVMVAMVL